MAGLGDTVAGPVGAEDIGDLERGAARRRSVAVLLALHQRAERSSGLITVRIVLVATRV